MENNTGDRKTEPNKKVNLLDILAEKAEREAIRQAGLVKSGAIYEDIRLEKIEQPSLIIDKAHIIARLESLTDIEPLYFSEYAVAESINSQMSYFTTIVYKGHPDRDNMKTLTTIVRNHLSRKQYKSYRYSMIWVKAPKGKRVLRVEIKKRGS